MPKTKVSELMIPINEYPVVHENDTLKEAIKSLKKSKKHGHRSVLVLNELQDAVGIMTEQDILRALQHNMMCYNNAEILQMSYVKFYHKDPILACTTTQVGQIMSPIIKAFVQVDDTTTTAIELMMKRKITYIPVLEDKKVVGILRAIDLVDYIGELL